MGPARQRNDVALHTFADIPMQCFAARQALRDSQKALSRNPLWNVEIIDWHGEKDSFVTIIDHCKYR